MFPAICLSLISLFSLHDFHVSITEMELKDNRITISQKLFSDDFSKALMLRGSSAVIGDDLLEKSINTEMRSYIAEHFSISTGEKKLEIKFAGAEWLDYHTLYMYWESEEVEDLTEEITIYNEIFTEVSREQQNMHYFRNNGRDEALLLNAEKTTGKLRISRP